ncbi:uncharacterized protein BDW43DRAFT_94454 [Aspergillus alliaceus]|uniref:uncharacterized protein n=1 Tax=Petromyces alliaceus TaxID=209559 RepID=UPI0012A7720E|nr:uncharacterized protein BDW43DRAFT_94454 [Aspergillus alliaceus]KAB8233116.1 hypothetical protein BDW43DRAFT_94454 [Aspergillus alliaceus]
MDFLATCCRPGWYLVSIDIYYGYGCMHAWLIVGISSTILQSTMVSLNDLLQPNIDP